MSAIKQNTPNTDYDAAQALLDLQNDPRSNQRTESVGADMSVALKEDMEKTAKLFLSCLITSNATKPANSCAPCYVKNEATVNLKDIQRKPTDNSNALLHKVPESSKRSRIFKRRPRKYTQEITSKSECARKVINNFNIMQCDNVVCNKSVKVETRNFGTQTEIEYNLPKIEVMESTIHKLCEKIQMLETQIKESNANTEVQIKSPSIVKKQDMSEEFISEKFEDDNNYDAFQIKDNTTHSFTDEDYKSPCKKHTSYNVLRNCNMYANKNDLVPIGDGHALVSSRLLRHINWNSYTSATRKLLTAVFSRSVLATHSLTGKPSPAFPNKPAKKKLDLALVNDIVQTVVERCCVPENVVRTSITTKCADESKMYRTRQKNVKKPKQKTNRENIQPDNHSSES